MTPTKNTVGYAVISIALITLSSNFGNVTCTSASEEIEQDAGTQNNQFEIDSMCDCGDPEALYNKIVRQILTDKGQEGKDRFLQEFRPKRVCGSDGLRYENGCELQCARSKSPESDLHSVHPVRNCRKRFRNGQKNAKRRSMKLESERKSAPLKMKEVEPVQELPHPRVCICPRHYFPVCGSNGVTYGNLCAFKCAKANLSPAMTLTHNGKCEDDDETVL